MTKEINANEYPLSKVSYLDYLRSKLADIPNL
jgi:hypothetical protein